MDITYQLEFIISILIENQKMSSTEIISLVSTFNLDENFNLNEKDIESFKSIIKNYNMYNASAVLQISVKNSILGKTPQETYKYYLLSKIIIADELNKAFV